MPHIRAETKQPQKGAANRSCVGCLSGTITKALREPKRPRVRKIAERLGLSSTTVQKISRSFAKAPLQIEPDRRLKHRESPGGERTGLELF